MGQVVRSWLRRLWTPSRAVALSEVFKGSERGSSRGLGSLARRWPRSKVYGVGFETVMGLSGRFVSCWDLLKMWLLN